MSFLPTLEKLRKYEDLGLIRSQSDSEGNLNIFVYTEFTSFEKLWNSVTMACRGLVVDNKGRCVVRCIPKFFNEGEFNPAPDTNFNNDQPIYFDKLDGSMIQVVRDNEYGFVVTSKGSFQSDQAVWARELLIGRESEFAEGLTYVFELIHPDNRIVLDYGSEKKLVLLAVLATETGDEYDINAKRFAHFKKAPVVDDVALHMSKLVEGVVMKRGKFRLKIKTAEYVRLHRIVTEFTPKRVWEAMSSGQSLEFTNMPEEFQKWLDDTIGELDRAFKVIESEAHYEHGRTLDKSDKEIGLSTDIMHKHLIFALRYGKDIKPLIWKMIKPKKD